MVSTPSGRACAARGLRAEQEGQRWRGQERPGQRCPIPACPGSGTPRGGGGGCLGPCWVPAAWLLELGAWCTAQGRPRHPGGLVAPGGAAVRWAPCLTPGCCSTDYMAHLVEVQHERGASGGQTFHSLLTASLPPRRGTSPAAPSTQHTASGAAQPQKGSPRPPSGQLLLWVVGPWVPLCSHGSC